MTWSATSQFQATVDALHEERRRVAESDRQQESKLATLRRQYEERLATLKSDQDGVLLRLGRALQENTELRHELDVLRAHVAKNCVDISRIPRRDEQRIREYCRHFEDDEGVQDNHEDAGGDYQEGDDSPIRTRMVRPRRRRRRRRRPKQQVAVHDVEDPLTSPPLARGDGMYTLRGYIPQRRR